ncbi:hypothetical protein, partial [Pectobacterium versatile]
MAPELLILRFRDTTVGIETIQAHQNIINSNGAVWWGWWKSEKEILNE